MADNRKVSIGMLPTGVPGLDEILGGGLPEYSFNLIAGEPGTGKTTLAHQMMFKNASLERPALYFTVLGEPAIKMLRYQQQFQFFDLDKLESAVRFFNLSDQVMKGDMNEVLQTMVREVEAVNPGMVVVDSFRTVSRAVTSEDPSVALQDFLQRLSLHLTGWQATTFLVGEYSDTDKTNNAVFTVADGILWLYQNVERNSSVRKIRVLKMRGRAPMPGLHTFRISDNGIHTFPRLITLGDQEQTLGTRKRLRTGIPGLDEMLSGGIPEGDSVLIAGPAGSGKTIFLQQFIAEGIAEGENGVMVTFEEHPLEYQRRANDLGIDLTQMVRDGKLKVIYLRPLDLSVDEALEEIQDSVRTIGAKRVTIDSLSGFELALAPTFRKDLRESLYRLVGALTGSGVTVIMTVEVVTSFTSLEFTQHLVSFLTDEIILLRYVELDGTLKKMIATIKMRGSQHSKELREYEITAQGLRIGRTLNNYSGLITGSPRLQQHKPFSYPGLTDQETSVMSLLTEMRQASLDELLRQSGLQRRTLNRALNRIVTLGYAVKTEEQNRALYRLPSESRD